jgi:hypothetical protein
MGSTLQYEIIPRPATIKRLRVKTARPIKRPYRYSKPLKHTKNPKKSLIFDKRRNKADPQFPNVNNTINVSKIQTLTLYALLGAGFSLLWESSGG